MNNKYHIRISPEVIKNNLFNVNYVGDADITQEIIPFCCDIYTQEVIQYPTETAPVYSSMTQILSGGTNGSSILTGLTIPILITENTVDVGYYSVFDGMVTQQEVMTNFLFSAQTSEPYTYYFYNTSDVEFKKYLNFSSYNIDWGDGFIENNITDISPNYYYHTYSQDGNFTITMSGMSPWGSNVIKKTVTVPYNNVIIDNPNGTSYFVPTGGSWSGTPLSYDYIFSGDSSCELYQNNNPFISVPVIITGYTNSSVSDLKVYGKKSELSDGSYKLGVPITGTSGVVGTYWGVSSDGNYTSYTINGIDYFDYIDGTTVFVVSGVTQIETVCEPMVKNEALLNVIDEPELQSDVFIERGKVSGLEAMERLGEVDNLGDLEKYGYKFFKIVNVT